MASYNRLGSFLLAEVLATNPGGTVVRAVATAGGAFQRHHLLRTFSDDLLEAGLGSRWGEAQRQANQLAGVRGVGANYRFESGKPACVVCDYIPGRSLATVLDRTRNEQIPLGVDHALTVLQSVAQAIIQMHDKNIHHGSLSPHSVWVGFEGATQILDAPYGAVIQGLLPKAPPLQAALAPYRAAAAAAANAFQQDLFALGAMFYELLTLEQLPAGPGIPAALAGATLKAAQEEARIPAEVLGMLKRLLLVAAPFASAAEFSGTLERVLYDGDYSPTTFNMAFLMHTLFRDESEQDAQAVKHEQGANFTPYLPPPPAAAGPGQARPARAASRTGTYLLAGGVVVALCGVGGMFVLYQQSNHQHQLEQQSLQAKLAAFQREKEANDARLADIAKQEEAQKTLEEMFGKQAEQGATQAARAAAMQELEAARLKTKDLARQRAEVMKEKQKLSQQAPVPLARPLPPALPAPAAAPVPAPAPPAAVAAAPAEAPPVITQKTAPQPPQGTRESLPAALQQTNLRVALKVFVDAAGRPQKVVIVKGVEGNYGYNDSAQNAALASSYAPASRNGKPAAGWLDLEYDFGKPK